MLGASQPAGGSADASGHWSACPKCGASKLSKMPIYTPVCSQSQLQTDGVRVKYMRCRMCQTRYKAVDPRGE